MGRGASDGPGLTQTRATHSRAAPGSPPGPFFVRNSTPMSRPCPTSRPLAPAAPGFSLIEVLVVVVIMGMMAMIAVPRFAAAATRRRLDNAATRVLADLRHAQQHALATSATVAVRFDPAAESYTVDAPSPTSGDPGYTVFLIDAPTGVAIRATTLASNRAQFDGHGRTVAAGTITLHAGSFERTLSIAAASTAIDAGTTVLGP